MKIFELVSSAIVEEGCRAVFGVVGDGNLSLWSAIGRDRRVPLYAAWHEGAAVAMADAYARSCGETAVATVTCGPGLTHAATSLISAARHGSPLVLIVGDLPADDIAGNQHLDQRGFAQVCGARFHRVSSPVHAADVIRNAFRDAYSYSCPVVLSLPMDIQEADVGTGIRYRPSRHTATFAVRAPDPSAVSAIVDLIESSDRPVIVAGRGAAGSETRNAVVSLANRIGAALGTSLPAKGLFSGHPRDIGVVGGIARGSTQRVLAEADLVIAMGTTLGYHTTDKGRQLPRAKIIRIDTKPAGSETGPASSLYIQADACAAATAVSGVLEKRQVRKTGFLGCMNEDRFKPQPWPEWPTTLDGMDPRRLMREVSKALPAQVQVSCGIGHFWSFPIMYLDLPDGGSFHSLHAFGAIGLGLPFGIGLAAAAPDRPVLVIEGDGSLMQSLPEFESAVRQKLSLVVLVMNDGGYGAEAHKMSAKGFDGNIARWDSPDFARLARAFGGTGMRIDSEADIQVALSQGFSDGGLHVIDARISPTVLSDLYRKTLFGTPIE